ncbi:MAG: hypothetical protein IJ270_06000 [Paludibacteraceae bacterium]|nr:hypothetical protein [Paludibacteraceae bacterium]
MNKISRIIFLLLLTFVALQTSAQTNVKVGDILCTDGTYLTPVEYLSSNKTADGVVFWIEPDGKKGYVFHTKKSKMYQMFPSEQPIEGFHITIMFIQIV